ncbi:mechanosensitive ion channel family protein [Candidatus Woesearchaeota archaeon]|nr:mechanosensitive ion channel family protein [Nanoarchaeota archaeon]MCB9370105.1 mechanosensitive ion channel family protein [Candidatus Woesearchaeota archaeon]USN44636.1 MAG: mechanosensitive ion channel family protein [Candidatus Woesearchaeota archaeon]
MDIPSFLATNYFGNSVQGYILALLITGIAMVLFVLFKQIIIGRIEAFSKTTKTKIDDRIVEVLNHINWPFYVVLPVYLGFRTLTLSGPFLRIFDLLLAVVIVYYVIKVLDIIMNIGAEMYIVKHQEKDRTFDRSFVDIIRVVVRILLWVIGILFVLDNLGIEITPLLTGLGIGGIAVAFALQSVLADIFAYFTIQSDKPFKIGDFIIIGTDMGTVKYIGIKSTRIQTLQGQELVVSNRELTDVRINNYKRMKKRRIVFSIGVVYETPTKKLHKILEILKDACAAQEKVTVDRVHFAKFGAYSLDYEVVYYLDSSDYNEYMTTQQNINFAIREAFEKEKIDMAFPTQTIYVNK